MVKTTVIIIIITIITVFIVRGLQDWPMAHYNCSYGVEMHVKNRENKIK